jgi:hypothetical protein
LRCFTLFALAAVLAAVPGAARAADTCALVSRAEASALLGQPAGAGAATPATRDEDSSGQLSYCTYRAPASALIVSVVEFATPGEARKSLTVNMVKSRMEEEATKVSEEPGIGERSFYAASAEGSMYVFLKGNKVVGLAVGGPSAPKAAAVKAALKASAIATAAKL